MNLLTTTLTIKLPRQQPALRVTEEVRLGVDKDKRRRRVKTLLGVVNALHKQTLERLAK